jgi:RimJ/RimL family protein N-acetyltransferase
MMNTGETALPAPERIIVEHAGNPVRLLQLVPDDAQAYYDLIAFDPDHLRQHGDETADKYPDTGAVRHSIEHPSNTSKYRFGIWDGDVMVGSDNLTPEGNGKAELGSWIGRQHVGQGYAGRGRELLIDFAFNTLGLSEVHCDIVVGNEASRRSVEKSGFEFAGEFADDEGERKWRYVHKKKPNND